MVVVSLMLMLLGQAPTEGQATLQSCVLESTGWVCRYKAPPGGVTVTPSMMPPGVPVTIKPPETSAGDAEAATAAEAARQARLIRRCADASWYALCTPNDRREAKLLQAAAEARARLRGDVTALAADGKCPEAVRTALQAGDLSLAKEIKDFCAAGD